MKPQLLPAIARICTPDGRVVGAGFLVGQRQLLTCAHVVAQALDLPAGAPSAPQADVHLDFPLVAPGQGLTAYVVCWRPALPNGGGDVAGLELTDDPPTGASPVRLVKTQEPWGHSFRAFGFPRGFDNGVWASGRMLDREATGWLQIEDVKHTGYFIAPGFSGGPVWDETLDGVVGMTVAADTALDVRAAFTIPTDQLVAAWPQLATWTIPPCPYRGLLAFREQDAPFFFGRETFTGRLVEAVRTHTLTAVVGPSGGGKSSAVFAGLLPRLRQADNSHPPREGWTIVQLRPGSHPFDELANALLPLLEPEMTETDRLIEIPKAAKAFRQGELVLHRVVERILEKNPQASRLLLVIDQFEELYTLCPDPTTRQAFLDLLLQTISPAPPHLRASSPLHLILTLRADFLGQALSYRPFADVLDQAQRLLLVPMTRDELETAIMRPAERQGVTFEDGLVARILDDVGDEPGNLPLLEFALTQMWEYQKDSRLTHTTYEAIGKVEGALTRYAEEIYAGLSDTEQATCRRIFLRLTQPGMGTEDTKRRVPFAELVPVEGDPMVVEAVIHRLASARLVTTEGDQMERFVEAAHEALIQGWSRLRTWVDENRESLHIHRRLTEAAHEWADNQQDASYLYWGMRLAQAELWRQTYVSDLSEVEQAFLTASLTERSKRQQKQAEANSRRLAKIALDQLRENSELALLLAIEAGHAAATTEANEALRAALLYRHLLKPLSGHTGAVRQAAWNPEGTCIATASADGTARVWNADSGAQLVVLSGHNDEVWQVAWSQSGTRLVTASDDSTARVWDVNSGKQLAVLVGHIGWVYHAAWNSNDTRIVTTGTDATARVWDAESGAQSVALIGHRKSPSSMLLMAHSRRPGRVYYAAWSLDDARIVTASADGTARVWDAESGAQLTVMRHSDTARWNWVYRAEWDPGDTRIVTASADNTARVWDAESGTRLAVLSGHTEWVHLASWSPDGTRIVTASHDGTVRVWDAESGAQLILLTSDVIKVEHAAWNPDGTRIVTTSRFLAPNLEHIVRIWDADTGKELAVFPGHTDRVRQTAWNGKGTRIVTSSDDGTARVWDVDTGERLAIYTSFESAKDLLEVARQYTLRNMSLEEWQRFMGEEKYRATCPNLPIPPE